VIIESPAVPGVVELGDKVLVQNQDGKIEQYTIVGSTEANPLEGRISNESPVGRALLGKKIGDEIEVRTPGGVLKLLIMDVS
jgi:transcription elongation factor GreA